jgi:CRP-like cAMP-binding protein
LTSADNALIARLDEADRTRFLDLCERAVLLPTTCLFQPGEPIDHVYFPNQGSVCVLMHEPDTPELIISMVGREGMLDPRAVLGIARTQIQAHVQSEGWAWRLPTKVFQQQLATNVALKRLMDRYVAVMLNQSARLALCLRFHDVSSRLARWLLMSQDRTGSNHCQVTHEALGIMLGVRRESITTAANVLQQRGAISYHRGDIHVLDRTMLEKMTCNCYRANCEIYEELLK